MVIIFTSVMNAPLVLERKNSGETLVGRTYGVRARFDFQDTHGVGEGAVVRNI